MVKITLNSNGDRPSCYAGPYDDGAVMVREGRLFPLLHCCIVGMFVSIPLQQGVWEIHEFSAAHRGNREGVWIRWRRKTKVSVQLYVEDVDKMN
jgi:hypothetical protein